MKQHSVFFSLVLLNFTLYTMEAPPHTEFSGNSNQEVPTLHLYNFQSNDELLNRPHVWFSYKQENLFEAGEISDKIRELIRNSKPLLIALKQVNIVLLDQKKDECTKLAHALNRASNILAARIMDCKPEYQQTPSYKQLSKYILRTFYILCDTQAGQRHIEFAQKLSKEDHPIIELEDAYDSIRNYIHNNH